MPVMPAADTKFTMRPQPCAFMCGCTACIAHSVPLTVPWLRSRSSSPTSAIATLAVNVCVVDQAVDAAVALDGRRDHGVDRRAFEDVALDAERLDAERRELVDDALDPMGLPLGHDDLGAVLAEVQGHAPPDALAGTGDEHDLAVDVPHGAQSMTPVSGSGPGRLAFISGSYI